MTDRDMRQKMTEGCQESGDIVSIHTIGLEEAIRCTLCRNPMKSTTGCDGGCRYNEDLLRDIMDTIYKFTTHEVSQKMSAEYFYQYTGRNEAADG